MAAQQRIVPLLRIPAWDHGTVGAARFYLDVFRPLEEAGLEVGAQGRTATQGTGDTAESTGTGGGQAGGIEVSVASFRLGLQDAADSAGQPAAMTTATNFTVNFDPLFFGWTPQAEESDPAAANAARSRARAALDTVWEALSDATSEASHGTGLEPSVLMPLDEYPFSPRYGWIQDCYGVSWQLMLTDPAGEPRPAIIPSFFFGGGAQNRAGEARDTWLRVFGEVFADAEAASEAETRPGVRVDYPEQAGPAQPGAVMFSDMQLAGTWFTAMDSATDQPSTFTDAVTYQIMCDTPFQAEALRRRLRSADGTGGTGGTDDFGVTWEPRYDG